MILSFLLGAAAIGLGFVGLALLIGLEITLANRDEVWPGLILPGLLALLGVLCYCKVPGYPLIWLLPLCLPALLVLGLYLTCRRLKCRCSVESPSVSPSGSEDSPVGEERGTIQ